MERGSSLEGGTVIFDLDGTLVDTAPDLVRALNEATARDGLDPTPIEEVRAMVGHGASALLRRAYVRCGTALPHTLLQVRTDQFLEAYVADIARHSRPFPGTLEMLDALAEAGARLVIATNKPDALADALLEALDLTARFDAVIGPSRAGQKKPAARHLEVAAGSSAALARSVMVGDAEPDAAAARAAGVPCILMRHGYSVEALADLGASAIAETPGEVPALVRALLGQRSGDR